ncbi:DUF1510 family protein [Halobacillus fulvus]|nr:DUF1510 family protein [Halobacillus fulvus]
MRYNEHRVKREETKMSNSNKPFSRSDRFEKKRKGTKLLTWLVGGVSLLFVALIALFIFGGDDQESTAKQSEQETEDVQQEENTSDQEQPEEEEESKELVVKENEEQKQSEDDESEKSDTLVVESSDDENVVRVLKKDWEPVQTEQDTNGNHSITYDKGSQDWQEMLQAIYNATGLTPGNMITQWIGNNGGPNKAVATVYNKENQNEIYRVYIEWIDQTGYQVQQIEELKSLPQSNG